VSEKGIDRGSYVNYHIASNRTITPKRKEVKEALSDTINKVYANTQEALGNSYLNPKGVKPVKLFRGNGEGEIKSVVSSWTPIDHIAANFGSAVSMVDAPPEAILLHYNEEHEDYWSYPGEREYVLAPGLLPANKKLHPEQLLSEQRQKILDKKLEQEAEVYSEDY